MSEKKLNQSQQQAVDYVAGPLLIVAGAGTGKTTVITEKIVSLIEKKLAKPEQILALAFNDHAALEMQERVDERLGSNYLDMNISTFHAFCQRLLEQYGLDIGIATNSKLLTEIDAWMLFRQNLHTFDLNYYRPLGNPAKHIHELVAHFSKCQDELITPEEYLKYAEGAVLDGDSIIGDEKTRVTEVANAYHRYMSLLVDNNTLDFSSLIYYAVKLLRERPHIAAKLQTQYKYVLVDEFQDVNFAQYELVRLLAGRQTSDVRRQTINKTQKQETDIRSLKSDVQLTVVGDDDQSIYAFRGASVANILRFTDDFHNAKHVVLNENYRSGQKILDTAYKSIQHNNPDRLEVKLNINKNLESRISNHESNVIHIHGQTSEEEVSKVIYEIIRLKKEQKEVAWDDFAILVRANNHADPFLQALSSAGIPYEFLASVGLYRQPIVIDAVNFFKLTENYHDSGAVYRLLRLPFLALSDADLQKFTAAAKKKSLLYYEALERASEWQLSVEGVAVCRKILSLVQSGVRQARSDKPTRVLYQFLEKSGYLQYLTREEGAGNSGVIRQIYQLKQFFTMLSAYEELHPEARVSEYLEHYRYSIEAGDGGDMYQPTDTPDSVNIMTVHAAKGLEFKYVFIVNLVEERFPTRPRGEAIPLPDALVKEETDAKDEHYNEERRLLYVAMTRAKERLYLTSADNYGGVRKKKLSRFLVEIGFTEKINESAIRRSDDQLRSIVSISEREVKDTVYPLPKTFSFSQIKAYETCPYQYKLAHILKIPTKSNASFSFGQSIHAALQCFYERMQELNSAMQGSLFATPTSSSSKSQTPEVPSLDDLFHIYDEFWIPDWYESKRQREEYYKKGKEILTLFYTSHDGQWTIPHALESSFKIMVGKYQIHGRIDRIDRLPDGTLEIIDYKTGKSKEKVVGDEKDQLLIYQIAAESLPQYRNIGPVGKLTFYYLNDNIKTTFFGTGKELEKLKEKLVKTIDNIHERDFTATPSSHICARCDFRDICEYRAV